MERKRPEVNSNGNNSITGVFLRTETEKNEAKIQKKKKKRKKTV